MLNAIYFGKIDILSNHHVMLYQLFGCCRFRITNLFDSIAASEVVRCDLIADRILRHVCGHAVFSNTMLLLQCHNVGLKVLTTMSQTLFNAIVYAEQHLA